MTFSLHLVLLLAALLGFIQARSQTRDILSVPLHAMPLVNDSHDTEATEQEGRLQSKSGSFNVTEVPMAPVFIRQDKMRHFVAKPAGHMLRLKCPAEGNPSPNITWFKNDATPDRHLRTFRYGRWWIMLEDLDTTDSGNYTCLVCNSYGCTNFTFKVDILPRFPHKPYIKDGYPHNVTANLNNSVVFHCPPISDLEPYIQWLRVSTVPTGDFNHAEDIVNATKILQADNDCLNTECMSPEVLEIHNVTHDDAGWYTCIAGNSLGISYASAYLDVVETLDPPVPMIKSPATAMIVNFPAGILGAMFLLVAVIIISVFRRLESQGVKLDGGGRKPYNLRSTVQQ